MNILRKTLSVEIENFVSILNREIKEAKTQVFTKSVFTQYRKKIRTEAFKALSDHLVNEFYTDYDESVKL